MELWIKKTDLTATPCVIYADLPDFFDAIEEINKRGSNYSDVSRLITNCEFAQTAEMMSLLILKKDV